MTQARGSRSQFLLIEEGLYGQTPPSSPANTWKIPFNTDSIVQQRNSFVSQEIRQDRMVPTVVQGNRSVQGSLNFELSCDNHAKLVKQAIGLLSQDSVSGAFYQHQIDGQATLPTSFSLEKGFTDVNQYFLYKGCRINRLAFTFPQEGYIMCSADFSGREEVTAQTSMLTSGVPLYLLDDPLASFEAVISQSVYGVSLASLVNVQAATINISNALKEDNYVIGDTRRASIPEGRREVTGQFTAFFEDLSLYNQYVNGTACQLQIVATKPTGQSWSWFLPRIYYTGNSPTPVIPSDRPIVMTLPFRAVRDPTTGTDVRLTIVNNIVAI